MIQITFLVLGLCLSVLNGQTCRGRYDPDVIGYCEVDTRCQGTALTIEQCQANRCCINATTPFPSMGSCLDRQVFTSIYNSTRGGFLADAFNYGFSQAGICSNCQAKAAFLAVAETVTDNFQQDEAPGPISAFTADDTLYGNQQAGDGSRYRRRGFFGLRGRTMYARANASASAYQLLTKPENAAITRIAMDLAVSLWLNPDLNSSSPLTSLADGSFYGFSMIWYRLGGDSNKLVAATKQYSKFLRLLECGGDLYPGQGGSCQYNATHNGSCIPGCIRGLEESGEWCGCSGEQGSMCTGAPAHVRCCLGSCSQELKMDLGLVLDASGSIGAADYQIQVDFVEDLLNRVNVGPNKTHVAIIKFSNSAETLTSLKTDYELNQKVRKLRQAPYNGGSTNTAAALREANQAFTPANGLRPVGEGAAQVVFVITDGESDNRTLTLHAASVLKDRSIHVVSVGVGSSLNLVELHGMCTPPSSQNYFAISNYNSLQSKLNQFMAKTCTEPAVVPGNTTVTGEVSQGKYKFFKLKIVFNGNKLMIKIKLVNGKVKLFYSFKARNPKDPAEFMSQTSRTFWSDVAERMETKMNSLKANDGFVTEVIDRPADLDSDIVYVGIKGVEVENKFEVKLEDCQQVKCAAMALKSHFFFFFFAFFSLFFFEILQLNKT